MKTKVSVDLDFEKNLPIIEFSLGDSSDMRDKAAGRFITLAEKSKLCGLRYVGVDSVNRSVYNITPINGDEYMIKKDVVALLQKAKGNPDFGKLPVEDFIEKYYKK